jgi:hypothetical protein
MGTTFAGGRYSSTCSSPDSTQVMRDRSTAYSRCSTPRAQTPVVTVKPRFTPMRRPSTSRGRVMPACRLTWIAPWWNPRTRKAGTAVKRLPCARAQM